ncbi:MAG: histidine kinase [Cyclobacteriaceae bacterium]|nr:histidine kinase [Cyclobacteriaceae bacterium]
MWKKLLTILIGAFIGITFLIYLSYSEYGKLPSLWMYLLAVIIGMLNSSFISFQNNKLNKWILWKGKEGFRLITGIAFNFVSALVITLMVVLPTLFIMSNVLFGQVVSSFSSLAIKFVIILFFGTLVYNVVYLAQYAYNQYAVIQIEVLKNERRQLKLQFEALKSQLSPHYLFNSLNTISYLVYKDANQAENFIRGLAQTYEYILSTNHSKFVLLSEEIEFVRSYNYLLQVRFANNVHLEIDLPDEILSSKIPPLTLQMLVENAVKHNEINEKQPIHIVVKALDNLDLQVVNAKTVSVGQKNSFEIGLSNIRLRYSLLSDKKIKVDDGEQFKVTLPIIPSLNLQSL